MPKLRVLFVSSEIAPFAKTGGLADVAQALPPALARLGAEVKVFMPLYRQVNREGLRKIKGGSFTLTASGIETEVEILQGSLAKGVPAYFIGNDRYFDREHLYGTPQGDYPDNAERFIFFCRALLDYVRANMASPPDIIHCNDWQTGLIPAYFKTTSGDDFFSATATAYTIHNLAYQGLFPLDRFPLTGLPPELAGMSGIEFWGQMNFMKAGINFSEVINTVSPTYAKEIQTPEFGYGLEGVLADRAADLHGILNGANYEVWDPSHDPLIPANYDANNPAGKARCKEALLKAYGLPSTKSPVIGIISRLADQKGFDLLAQAIDRIMAMDTILVLLGTGDQKYHDMFEEIGRRYPKRAGIRIGFDNKLAHLIEAGADMFLMPSRYEPGGLNQLYSFRYGTLPIVRATGGLDDTVSDYDPATGEGTGFKFREYSAEAMLAKIRTALDSFADKKAWERLVKRAMQLDFSWDKSARSYLDLYQTALNKRRQ
ncbi:MAG: glycogen synthase GlgA [Pseudomonadota bacterium]